MMKKALALIMALAMMFSLCACTASLDEETLAQLDDIESRLDAIEAQLGGEVAEETEETEETEEITVLIPPVQTGAHLADILLSACGIEGYSYPYGETFYDTITAVNTIGFEASWTRGEENPAAEYKSVSEGGEKVTVDFTWNGNKEVWSVLPTTGAEGLVMINDAMGAVMEAEGFTYVKKDAEGQATNQVQFIEDAIAAGNVGAIMCAAMDVDLLQDVVVKALEAGIAVAYLGAEPVNYGISGCVYTAYEITGMYAVQAAEDWVLNSGANVPTDENGKYEIAIDTYYDIADGVYRSNAMIGTIEKSENLVLVSETSSYGSSAYSTAYTNAQDVLGAHPNCHLFIAYEPEEAMGAADAIKDYCEVNGLSEADYCVIPCYAEDTAFTEMYNESVADASANAVKGYATYGDPAIVAGEEAEAMYGAAYEALVAYAKG